MKSSNLNLKYGDIRDDGYVFNCYRKVDGIRYGLWLSPSVFEKRKQKQKEYSKSRASKIADAKALFRLFNPPPIKSRFPDCEKPTLFKYKDVRKDGFTFLCYGWRNGKWNEKWESPERLIRRVLVYRAKGKERSKKRSQSPELLKKHAEEEANRRKDATYRRNQTKVKTEWARNKCENDPAFRIMKNYRKRVWDAVKGRKSAKTEELLGITSEGLKQHLESRFIPGMTFDNYGLWHVDHIKPCSLFDLSDPNQQRACFNYTNLQPLWAKDNFRKSDKFLSLIHEKL